MRKICVFFVLLLAISVNGQTLQKEFSFKQGNLLEVVNLNGKVLVTADEKFTDKILLEAQSNKQITESEIIAITTNNKVTLNIGNAKLPKRIDISIKIPIQSSVKIKTNEGEVILTGKISNAEILTETGTIATDIPIKTVNYQLWWTASRPRFMADFPLEKVKEKNAGKFVIQGNFQKEETQTEPQTEENKEVEPPTKLLLTTARGIILLNVALKDAPNDLRERPLTNAVKAIVRSGDSMLMEAIRKASPKYFGEYAATMPPSKREPSLREKKNPSDVVNSEIKRANIKVLDDKNRAIPNLSAKDFTILEAGKELEVLDITNATAPFNLVLLLDVSGSVEDYEDFIRKTATEFVNTMNPNDRISIVTFRDDVQTLNRFTTDRKELVQSLASLESGGSTSLYDSIAYVLADTLRPLRGERTAIVVLSDGDDNHSFLSFNALRGTIEESGALIYPLFVPSELIANSKRLGLDTGIDSLRNRYLSLTSKAEEEGKLLAEYSGGAYYPIKKIEELNKAYEDIVVQLRSAYSVTFRSNSENVSLPRLKAKVNRPNTFTKINSVGEVPPNEAEKYLPKIAKEPEVIDNEIKGEVKLVSYKPLLGNKLRELKSDKFDINTSPTSFILDGKVAVSRWLSPKRSRSYPFERVYNTLNFNGKKVAVIPVVKDEGLGGERDFIQWDTISLLNLLDVHVVLAYYNEATKNVKRPDQITNQKFDKDFITSKLKEIQDFNSTPSDWNERESQNLKNILQAAKESYKQISEKTKTALHDSGSLDELINYAETPQKFIEFSREKSQKAQGREFVTDQPKEALSTDTKGRVTITNSLFGKYFFTCDETKIEDGKVFLIEAKHSTRNILPSESDIKDGLLKMMFYTNLQNVRIGKNKFEAKAMLKLTSSKMVGSINSNVTAEELENFFKANLFDLKTKNLIKNLFQEAKENNFTIILEQAETAK
ncbi:MAG: VWA domain-containing protein [Pyrinomonadaceae bacterium]|nr:VWA domain-containing protein [Pyrinomonadaceae bacterium]